MWCEASARCTLKIAMDSTTRLWRTIQVDMCVLERQEFSYQLFSFIEYEQRKLSCYTKRLLKDGVKEIMKLTLNTGALTLVVTTLESRSMH